MITMVGFNMTKIPKKLWRTNISVEEMILAKTDDVKMMEILNRVDPYIKFISYKISTVYGLEHDYSWSMEDIESFCRVNIIAAIRYYNPSKYDKKKDKRGINNNGFAYIVNTTDRWIKKLYDFYHPRYHSKDGMQKRIPIEKIDSVETPVYWNNEIMVLGDTLKSHDKYTCEYYDVMKIILEYLRINDRIINNISVYDVTIDLFVNNLSHDRIAKKHNISTKDFKLFLKKEIIRHLSVTKLER